MGNTRVSEVVVFSPLPPTDEEHKAGIVYSASGDLTEPELVDKYIEDSETRSNLTANAGNISVTVVPGKHLGHVSINIQFEGKSGLYDFCLHNQGELLDKATGWLSSFLDELGADFDVRIEAKPCPKTDQRLPLKRALENLGTVCPRIETTHNVAQRFECTHTVKNKTDD